MSLTPRSENFLRAYMRLNAGTEVPDRFAMWAGLSGVSAALGRRVWIDRGHFTIYPNLFVVLVAGSGRCRKSTAIDMIVDILKGMSTPPRLLPQATSKEALIEALQEAHVQPGATHVGGSIEGVVVADELSTFLNPDSYRAGLGITLIPLYDCKKTYEYRTKIRGRELLSNVCLGLLSGSTIDGIRKAIPVEAVGEGLTSRMMFVYVETPNPPVPWTETTPEKTALRVELSRMLDDIALAAGAMTLTPEAKVQYDAMYMKFAQTTTMYDNAMLAGYASRRDVHILKLAMILAAIDRTTFIEPRHLDGAAAVVRDVEDRLVRVLQLITSSEHGELVDRIYSMIAATGTKGLSRVALLRATSHRADVRALSDVIETLIHSRRVRVEVRGESVFYVDIQKENPS